MAHRCRRDSIRTRTRVTVIGETAYSTLYLCRRHTLLLRRYLAKMLGMRYDAEHDVL